MVGDLVVSLPFRDEPIADTHGATQMDSGISLVVGTDKRVPLSRLLAALHTLMLRYVRGCVSET